MGCECAAELQGALAAMLELLKSVNDSMHQAAITGYEVRLIHPHVEGGKPPLPQQPRRSCISVRGYICWSVSAWLRAPTEAGEGGTAGSGCYEHGGRVTL